MDIIVILLCIIIFLMNFKWIFILFMFPWIVLDKFREKGKIGYIASLPYKVCEKMSKGGIMRFAIFNIGTIPSNSLRKLIYRMLCGRIESNVTIHFGTEIRCPRKLRIGKGTIIGDNAILDARCGLTMGENVNLSSNVSIYTLQHDHRDPYFRCNETQKKMSVEIDDRVWLGSNVIVLPGVHIGEGAVCCAGCVVTKDVLPYTVVAGIPAKKVGERPRVLKYEFNGKTCAFY